MKLLLAQLLQLQVLLLQLLLQKFALMVTLLQLTREALIVLDEDGVGLLQLWGWRLVL